MSEFVNTVDLVGDAALTASIVDRSITEIADNYTKVIGKNAFRNCSKLKSAIFLSATTISESAFYYSGVKSVELPAVVSIGKTAFYYSSLLGVSLPLVTEAGNGLFRGCHSLQTASLPLLTTTDYTFYDCNKLTSVYLPNVHTVGGYTFDYCSTLTTLDLPLATSIGSCAMRCRSLVSLILRSNILCTLANTNAFNNSPIASGTGYVYVPASLIDSYKIATNWSTYASQFRALENYTVDSTTTGELDPTKI